MVDGWVCWSLGRSFIPWLHLTTLLRRLWLQTNLYCADSGSKRISTAQTLAPNESLLRRLWLQTNLYCADSGSKRICTVQTRAPNESLLRRLWLQTNLYCTDSGSKRISTALTLAPKNLYCADSGSKWISKNRACRYGWLGLLEFGQEFHSVAPPHDTTAQTLASNESQLRRLGLQTNLYCADSGSKRISTAQTRAPNKSLLCRLWLQTNLYCADSGSKQIYTAQTLAPNVFIFSRWQRPCWDVFASLFYSGRKQRPSFLQFMFQTSMK